MHMAKVVVTGGAGFIGSYICDMLYEKGYQVIIIDDLSTGKRNNITHLLSHHNVDFILGSITDLNLLKKAFKGIDCVYHEAAITSVPRSIENPVATNEVNVTGILKVLIAARDNGVKKVVYASSSSVYGDTPTLPKTEDMPPNPQSPYAAAKLAGEYYCLVFNKIYGLTTACLRYFNVYGPRQNPDSEYSAVIPRFIKAINAGQPPIIFGDGEQTRDFIFVKDVARANLLAAESDATGIFNISSGERISLNQLSRLLLNLMDKPNIEPVYETERAGDIKHSLADITLAKTFGYAPTHSLGEGLKESIKEYRSHT